MRLQPPTYLEVTRAILLFKHKIRDSKLYDLLNGDKLDDLLYKTNDTTWTNEERLNDLKLQLCRKFGVGVDDIFCQWVFDLTTSTSTFRLSMHVPDTLGNFKYEHTDIEVFINEIQNALLKDQIRDDKLNILLK